MSDSQKVWVVVEMSAGVMKPVSFEAIHAARLLADSIHGSVEAYASAMRSPIRWMTCFIMVLTR